LTKVLKNDGTQTSDEPYEDVIGYPFSRHGNAGTPDLQKGTVKLPLHSKKLPFRSIFDIDDFVKSFFVNDFARFGKKAVRYPAA